MRLPAAEVLRPRATFSKRIGTRVLGLVPLGFRLLRRFAPVLQVGQTVIVTRYDDVREVFASDRSFGVPYWPKLKVITGGEPFFLGMEDTPQYRSSIAAMNAVVQPTDLAQLGDRAEEIASSVVARSAGNLEVVQFVRETTFSLLGEYFGVPDPDGKLQRWATRLFEFQFADPKDDAQLRTEVDRIAPALRAHIDQEIARRKQLPDPGQDVLGRCLRKQAIGTPGYADVEVRTSLMCMIVGGPPQPPMVVPQALEQLFRRPSQLQSAVAAAARGDDGLLHDKLFEAMRFDPLAPALPRVALKDALIARGTPRETAVREGTTVLAAIASAMMDSRRVPEPRRFHAGRRRHEYMHFGHGLHECFGGHINHATLHRMVRPLLLQPGLRRAPGRSGRLLKSGPFADRLWVCFDHSSARPVKAA